MFSEEDLISFEEKKREKLKTSHGRFHHRISLWRDHGYQDLWNANRVSNKKPELREKELKLLKLKVSWAKTQHHFWWFVHNCIAHPMIGLLPIKKTFSFHDY